MSEAEETRAEVRAVLRRMVKGKNKQTSVQAIGPPWRKGEREVESRWTTEVGCTAQKRTGEGRKENRVKNRRRLYKAMKLVSSRWPLPPPAA